MAVLYFELDMNNATNYHAALYCRLSKDDDQSGESVSIGTQRAILEDYCRDQGYPIYKVYTSMTAIPARTLIVQGSRSYWMMWNVAQSIWSSPRIYPAWEGTTS